MTSQCTHLAVVRSSVHPTFGRCTRVFPRCGGGRRGGGFLCRAGNKPSSRCRSGSGDWGSLGVLRPSGGCGWLRWACSTSRSSTRNRPDALAGDRNRCPVRFDAASAVTRPQPVTHSPASVASVLASQDRDQTMKSSNVNSTASISAVQTASSSDVFLRVISAAGMLPSSTAVFRA